MSSKLTIAVLLLAAPFGFAQSPQVETDKPAFEVASVKINKSGDPRSSMQLNNPGSFVVTNLWLPSLISFAYKVPPGKLSGGPAWMMTERFDISAKTDGKADIEQKMLMLRTLLEDRFKLKIRVETLRAYSISIFRRAWRDWICTVDPPARLVPAPTVVLQSSPLFRNSSDSNSNPSAARSKRSSSTASSGRRRISKSARVRSSRSAASGTRA
jgi:hypothetical protein